MDNYLSGRWPASMTPTPAPKEKKKKHRKNGRGRRVWRTILIILLALVMLGGLAVGSYFGIQYAADQMLNQQPGTDLPAQPSLPAHSQTPGNPTPSQSVEGLEWSVDLLPRAAHDPSVQVELRSREGQEPMTSTEIYKKVLPSIVAVEVFNGMGYGMGSGVVVSESGYIITNYHVVEGGIELNVMLLSDRTVHKAALVGYDKELDLAVLKAEGTGFVPAEFGSSDELEVGNDVYAIGNPLGYLYGAMTDGIVSGLDDRVTQLDYPGRVIQTSAALNSGNSGGALVDVYGRVVGITYAKVTGIRNDTVVEGLGLAIPMSDAVSYINRIFRTGDSSRPSLGILCYSPVEAFGHVGIQVAEATAGTPADGKLLPNDLIIACNGITVRVVDDMTRLLSQMDPGDVVELTVIRKGVEMTVTVELYDRLSELQ